MTRMKTLFCLLIVFVFSQSGQAQNDGLISIFAHNDYEQLFPFYNAYHHQVDFIEADIFLHKKALLVAHSIPEIENGKTLEKLYLKPLQDQIVKNNGSVYEDARKMLHLVVDIKSNALETLNALVKVLQKYPRLTSCPTLTIIISGNMPDQVLWDTFPGFIHFDGRGGVDYSVSQLNRIGLISENFRSLTKWNGKGVLTEDDRRKVSTVIDRAHEMGKKMRFWATPDFNNAWLQLMHLGVDVINTDDVDGLAGFIKTLPDNTFINAVPHECYKPLSNFADDGLPRNVILMIGDGMGLSQLYSGFTANHGQLNIFNIANIGFSITAASDTYITDSAAGATAMATGSKTNNRFIGVGPLGDSLVNISDKLKLIGYRTAIISNGDITDATPAAFYAHQPERGYNEAIAKDFTATDQDILIGGGGKHFIDRKDQLNLWSALKQKGYKVSNSLSSLDTINSNKFVILDDDASKSVLMGRKDFLSQALNKSIGLLSKDGEPFFLMLEGAQIDGGGHSNNLSYLVTEMLDFDQAVGEAMKYVDGNKETLLIVTADHETGGLSLLDGDFSKGYVHGHFSSTDHTAIMVPVFAYGPGARHFRGTYQNTEIYWKILLALNNTLLISGSQE